MATLSATITADETVIPVSGSAPEPGSYLSVGSEAIQFLGTSRGPQGRSYQRSYWSVDRGVAGTTKAAHSSGSSLTQYYPDAEGGGGGSGVTVDNGTDPPASVTTLNVAGADVSVAGAATLVVGSLTNRAHYLAAKTIAADGISVSLDWSDGSLTMSDTVFLDLTDPALPTFDDAGVYALSAFVEPTFTMTAGGSFRAWLTVVDDGVEVSAMGLASNDTVNAYSPSVALSMTWYMAAGGTIRLNVANVDGVQTGPFEATVAIQRLSPPAS